VRHVVRNSVRSRRVRAMTAYLTGYLGVWIAFGAVAVVFVGVAQRNGVTQHALMIAMSVVAAAWQLTRWKRRAVVACGKTVALPPSGYRADAACVRFGVRRAARCVTSCWALMTLLTVIGHQNIAVAGALTTIAICEERTPLGRRLLKPLAVLLGFVAVALVTLG
jgi:predicted metal-binding membrane protein